ncbi:MAG TPA: RHS repeat-associated core domain-containing protein, partial [Polyangiaceae bacterium]|nr:RHS repeat-associated core domain-containing protein [Polyangiaceae bacterium]
MLSKPGFEVFELDSGNRLRASRDEAFTYDERNHLAERRSSDGSVTRYTYDSFDLLVRIERSAAELTLWPPQLDPEINLGASPYPNVSSPRPPDLHWHAAYDALGRRLWTSWGNSRREFLWDGDRLAAEQLPSGIFRIYQYASPNALTPLAFTDYDSLDAPLDSGKPYHIFSNPVGIPLRIEDARAATVWRAQRIDPYGAIELEPGASLEYNLRWPGHYHDPETGLHYNRYRYYDPALGRYLQSDPIGYAGSPVNLYAYCPNPLVQVDVLGLDHEGKASKSGSEQTADSDGKEGTSSDNPSPKSGASEPTAEERILAASHGDTPAHRDAREKVVRHFYGDKPGLGQKRAEQDMGYG